MKQAAAVALALATSASAVIAQTAAAPRQYPVGYGPNPILPAPQPQVLPTINIAKAEPWPSGTHPVAAPGLKVSAYAVSLDHPRWLYVLPNGDVLVAETNSPPREAKGIKGMVMKGAMKRAGAATKSADRITLLRGMDLDGMAPVRTTFLANLHSPFGMALVGNEFYVAHADSLWRYPYRFGETAITARGTKVADLPAGINHHWTKNLIASPDGRKLYVAVGSNSNIGEHGLEIEEGRAAIWEFDRATGRGRVFASGLRNPVGMAFNPDSGKLWTAVNERDALGDDLVPDYMTEVKDGAFYGWPYSYFGRNVDARVKPQRPDLVAKAVVPDYALGAHTASLGLAFYTGALLPQFRNGALVGQHGSWNREPHSGYKLVFVPFSGGSPSGPPVDVVTGFLSPDKKAHGRPVGVAVDREGAILLADDVGNTIWRVTPATQQAR